MKKFLADFISRLTSRKFLLTLGTSFTLAANDQWTALVAALTAYLASEGGADVVGRLQSGKQKVAEIQQSISKIENGIDEGLDKSTVVPGVPSDIPM